jgi:hypothetical protein
MYFNLSNKKTQMENLFYHCGTKTNDSNEKYAGNTWGSFF